MAVVVTPSAATIVLADVSSWTVDGVAYPVGVTDNGVFIGVTFEPAPSNTLDGTLTIQLDDIVFAADQFWGGMRLIPLAFRESTRGTGVESTRGTMRERARGTMREGRRR